MTDLVSGEKHEVQRDRGKRRRAEGNDVDHSKYGSLQACSYTAATK